MAEQTYDEKVIEFTQNAKQHEVPFSKTKIDVLKTSISITTTFIAIVATFFDKGKITNPASLPYLWWTLVCFVSFLAFSFLYILLVSYHKDRLKVHHLAIDSYIEMDKIENDDPKRIALMGLLKFFSLSPDILEKLPPYMNNFINEKPKYLNCTFKRIVEDAGYEQEFFYNKIFIKHKSAWKITITEKPLYAICLLSLIAGVINIMIYFHINFM